MAGMITRPAQRTVCGMLTGAGLAGVWHHSRAHRFFAAARWNADAVGLTVLRLIVGYLLPVGAPLVVAAEEQLVLEARIHPTALPVDCHAFAQPGLYDARHRTADCGSTATMRCTWSRRGSPSGVLGIAWSWPS